VHLVLTNEGPSEVTVTVTANNYRSDGPWNYVIASGQQRLDSWRAGL